MNLSKAITAYKKMRKTTLSCRVIEGQRLLDLAKKGTTAQQGKVRGLIETTPSLIIECHCERSHDCAFWTAEGCLCSHWKEYPDLKALQCASLQVVGKSGSMLYRIGMGIVHSRVRRRAITGISRSSLSSLLLANAPTYNPASTYSPISDEETSWLSR